MKISEITAGNPLGKTPTITRHDGNGFDFRFLHKDQARQFSYLVPRIIEKEGGSSDFVPNQRKNRRGNNGRTFVRQILPGQFRNITKLNKPTTTRRPREFKGENPVLLCK